MANEGPQKSLRLSIVVSSGAGTGTITNEWISARWVRVIPINETDTFDMTIKDGEGFLMLARTNLLGTFSEKCEMSLGIMRTIVIANAAVDGTYQVRFDTH